MANRITGLATGLDVDELVKTTMKAYQTKIDLQTQKKDVLEIKQKLYRDIISEGKEFYDKYFNLAKSDSLLSSKNYVTTKFDSSDTMVATATGLSGAVKDNYKVNVTQVAETAKKTYSGSELVGDIEIKSNNQSVFIKASELDGKTDREKAALINSKVTSIGLTASVSDFKEGITIETKGTGKSSTFSINIGGSIVDATVNGTTSPEILTAGWSVSDLYSDTASDLMFNVGGKSVIIKASELKDSIKSLQEEIDKLDGTIPEEATKIEQLEKEKSRVINSTINSKLSTVGLKSTLSDDLSNITIESNTSGEKFTFTSGTAVDTHTTGGTVSTFEGKNLHATFSNSKGTVVYDDTNVSPTNKPVLDGVQFNITDVGEAKFVGKTDVTDTKNKIINLVNDYNKLIEKLNKLTLETHDRSYAPLSASQKEEMTEKEIELWNEKVEKGQLSRDSDLKRIVNNLKNAMTSSVIGSTTTLEAIGISPLKNYTTKNGMLEINEDKLTAALESDSEAVMNIFLQKPEDTTGMTESEIKSRTGIMYRMKDILNDEFVSTSKSALINKAGIEGTVSFTQSTLSRQITEYEKKIKQMNSTLSDKEQALYNKYASLETAMNNFNSQAMYLSNFFGGASS
ncbi:MAG: flagellar filament capping protein FliD [Clostridiales bacterium]|nr:flagellar filament capping protein FliD [Clostridiales bacterium]